MADPKDMWPWANRENEYRLLFPAAVEAVAEILEVAQPGAGFRLRDAGVEAVPAPWPLGEAPGVETPAGKWIALYRDLPRTDPREPREEQVAQLLLGDLNQAIWHASQGGWLAAARELKSALRVAWNITGFRP